MLIDLIPVERLPWIIVWVDWNFYAYWNSFVVFELIFQIHYVIWTYNMLGATLGISGSILAVFIGFCAWTVWCAAIHGYSVG